MWRTCCQRRKTTMGKPPFQGFQGAGAGGRKSYGKHCRYVYVIKCTYAVRRANRIPMTLKLRRLVKPDCLSIALRNSNHWFHVNSSPPLIGFGPWAKDLLEMSVVKTVQFTYCVGWEMLAANGERSSEWCSKW